MADWEELRAAASENAGLIDWRLEITEGQDALLELGATARDATGEVFDWTLCSEPNASIYDAETEAPIATLTWVPRADGTFAFTASRADLSGTAGDKRAAPQGRSASWACEVTIPGGHHIQLVAESPVTIRHKGVA